MHYSKGGEPTLTHGTRRYNSTCTNSIVHVYIGSNFDSVPSLLSSAYRIYWINALGAC